MINKPFIVAHIVPTGIRANIGGYIADATPATNIMTTVADFVVTHPNVVNGSLLNLAHRAILYTEGLFLDELFLGKIGLRPVFGNRVGVIIENTGHNQTGIDLALNTIETLRGIGGVDVVGVAYTAGPIEKSVTKTPTGAFVGDIANPDIFLQPAQRLIAAGATALAITTEIPVDPKDMSDYFRGLVPNPYGGLEAIISHTIGKSFHLPAAHAPLLNKSELLAFQFDHSPAQGRADRRGAGENITGAYLGCILRGLQHAPQPIPCDQVQSQDITIADISAVVVPFHTLGGVPSLVASQRGIPIIEVKENNTIFEVSAEQLHLRGVITVENYLETVGVLAALKEGIDWRLVRRPFKPVTVLDN